MNKKVIITGANGFVGSNLSVYLEKNQIDIQKLSLRNSWEEKIDRNVQAIIHLAGKAHDTKNTSETSEYFKINTDLTQKLFDIFLNSDCKDFFYFSSVKAVADEVPNVLLENVVPTPKTPYGESKLKAEEYILSKTLPLGKRVFIVRPCMIHGPGNKGNLNLLYKVVRKGIPYPLAAYKNERSFLSIDNLNFLIYQMLSKSEIPSGIYNFADDDFVSTNDLIQIIGKAIGKKSRLWNIPKSLINMMAKCGDIFKLPLNTERLTKLTENYKVSNQKVKKELGINKLPVSAEEGLMITIKSFEK
ncbi:MAG: NAD-dependent epimerase/dehydratase family protein [Limnohabitans sp.]|nr:NAD-dependent epimerase/dehydratase family protein [Limnohabitans sp.]